MPKLSYGPAAKQRTLYLLLALLDYGNDELVVADESALERLRSQLTLHWSTDRQLIVRTKIRNLETLTQLAPGDQSLSNAQLKTSLNHLENHLGILEDNRTSRRGSDTWHFTVTLWHARRDRAAITERFDQVWEQQRNSRSKPAVTTISHDANRAEAGPYKKSEASEQTAIEIKVQTETELWQQRCRHALNQADHTMLTTNPLTVTAGFQFDLADLYMPLSLIKRETNGNSDQSDRPEAEGENTLSTETLLTRIQQQDIRCLAIVGEPGAGKTTLLQQISQWVLDQSTGLPILIPLANLEGQSLEDYLLQDWLKLALGQRIVTPDQQQSLAAQIDQGQVWLLLDAVDEMADASSLALTRLAKQLQGWLNHARIIITCRLSLWDTGKNALSALPTYQLQGYRGYRNQIEPFIRKWFHANPDRGDVLCRQLTLPEHKRLRNNLRSPLRLALFCRIGSRGDLPQTQHQLYQQFVTALYDWKQDYFPTSLIEQHQINHVLAQLARKALHQGAFRLPLTLITQCLASDEYLWFERAVQLGWLIPIATTTGEKVYRFLHGTFQDYFAAQAIDHWQTFITSQGKTLPIGAPAWEAVILLWLGRDDIDDADKTALINALITFEDGCGGFFSDRAWLLAGRALGEYPQYAQSDQIIAKLMDWRFNRTRQVSPILIEGSKAALAESDLSRVAQALATLAQDTSRDVFDRWMAAYSLGRSYEPDSEVAIATLTELLDKMRNPQLKMDLARHLGILAPAHSLAVASLVNILETNSKPAIQIKAALRLAKVDPNHPLPLATFEDLLANTPTPQSQKQITTALAEINPNHPLLAQAHLPDKQQSKTRRRSQKSKSDNPYQPDSAVLIDKTLERLQQATNDASRLNLANKLGQLKPGHSTAIEVLWQYIETPKDDHQLKLACEALQACVLEHQIVLLAGQLRLLYEKASEMEWPGRKTLYFKLLWSWADELGYATFCRAWQNTNHSNCQTTYLN